MLEFYNGTRMNSEVRIQNEINLGENTLRHYTLNV